MRMWRVAATCAAVLIALAGCGPEDGASGTPVSGGSAPAPSTTGAARGLEVVIERSRLFETRGQLSLVLINHGPDAVQLDTFKLRSSLFETVAPDRREAELAPGGRRVSMPISFGAPRCDAQDSGHRVAIDAGGVTRELDAELHPRVHDLWRKACAAAAVEQAADIRFGEEWTAIDDVSMQGRLELRLREPARVLEVEELAGSVIFGIDATEGVAPLGRIDEGQPMIDIPVTVRAARCDPHALIESKRTYVFVVFLRLDGEEITVTVEPGSRQPFDRLLEPCLS